MRRKEIIILNDLFTNGKAGNRSIVPEASSLPPPSFGTRDELFFEARNIGRLPITGERGSACCATISDPSGQKLLLGISHSKTIYFKLTRQLLKDLEVPEKIYYSRYV
jgi:hypothetical protein